MVLGVVFQCYLICHAGCHRYGAQSGCSDQRIDFLLCEEVEQFDEEDATRYGKGECKEAPITIPIVVKFRNASAVMVAPTDNPKKMVAAFMMLFDAASNRRNVLVPISLTRLPNISIPINGTALGTNRATTVVTTIGKMIFKTRKFFDLRSGRVFLFLFLHIDG